MDDAVYRRLAKVLDTLPNGFAETKSGVEIQILKKIFSPEQADMFCDLRMSFETARQIAERTGRPPAGLEDFLVEMSNAGQIMMLDFGEKYFKMMPYVFGIYEFQLDRMDAEFARLNETFYADHARHFFSHTPQLMQVLPVEEEIAVQQEALPYERVSALIEYNQSFKISECICKKEKGLLNEPCQKPIHVCLAMAPIPGVFQDSAFGRVVSREEAYEVLKKSEEAGLVHLTSNIQNGNIYICNCCGCCCGVLSAINKTGIPASQVVNSHYFALIDAEKCSACGICADERCQVGAIEQIGDEYRIAKEKCIGCGLCISTCPTEAISLIHKEEAHRSTPPLTEDEWFEARGKSRGVDFSDYK